MAHTCEQDDLSLPQNVANGSTEQRANERAQENGARDHSLHRRRGTHCGWEGVLHGRECAGNDSCPSSAAISEELAGEGPCTGGVRVAACNTDCERTPIEENRRLRRRERGRSDQERAWGE